MILKDGEKQVTFKLDEALWHRFRVATVASGTSMTAEIVAFLRGRYPAAPQGRSKKREKEVSQAGA